MLPYPLHIDACVSQLMISGRGSAIHWWLVFNLCSLAKNGDPLYSTGVYPLSAWDSCIVTAHLSPWANRWLFTAPPIHRKTRSDAMNCHMFCQATPLSFQVPCLKIVTEVPPISDTLISSQWPISSEVGVVWGGQKQQERELQWWLSGCQLISLANMHPATHFWEQI